MREEEARLTWARQIHMLSRSLDNRDMLLSTATGRARIGCAEGVNYSAVTTGRHKPICVVPGVLLWSGASE
jgi:hypothetical protein